MNRFTKLGGIALAVLLVVGVASFFVGSRLEEDSAFCAKCHTHNEIYSRFTAERKNIKDLAGEHRIGSKNQVACIDCHREPGFIGHVASLGRAGIALGRYVTGMYEMPIKVTTPPSAAICRQCHSTKAKGEKHIAGHYHETEILDKGGKKMGTTILCADCHSAHDPSGKKNRWVSNSESDDLCDKCHSAMGIEDEVSEKVEEFRHERDLMLLERARLAREKQMSEDAKAQPVD